MQKILSTMRHACDKYNLIEENDRIGVGISGGKDSLVLIKALKMYQGFGFEIIGIRENALRYQDDTYADEYLMVKKL